MPFDVFLMQVLTTFYRRVYIFAKHIDQIPTIESDLADDIRLLTPADSELYCAQRQLPSAAAFLERLRSGHLCFAAFSERQVVHSGWAATDRPYIPYLNRRLALRPHEFYIYDTHTVPGFRNHGLLKLRNAYMQRYFHERGYTHSVGVVAVENKPAVQAALAVHYQIIGQYACLRLGPLQWDWQKPIINEPLPTLLPPT